MLPSDLRPGRHRKRRKTKTSSDASREAPERARKDTPKEAKLHYEGSCPFFCVFPVKFLRLPSDASQVRRGWATVLRLPAREICFVTAAPAFIPAPRRLPIIPQNQVRGGKKPHRTRHARFPVQGATDRNLPYFHLQLILGITSYCIHYTKSAKRINCASTFSIVLNCSVRHQF